MTQQSNIDPGIGSLGFVGLGNMGQPMAGRMIAAGYALSVFDAAGTQARAPAGARLAASTGMLAAEVETILLSVPDGQAVEAIVAEILAQPKPRLKAVVDHSTIGVAAATRAARALAEAGIAYLDAPVSGGVAGAHGGTLTLMVAGEEALFRRLEPAFAAFASNRFYVGGLPGLGQGMKLVNNVLSAAAMVMTSEAVALGERLGLELKTMIDVINVSTGRNTATSDKFPRRILTGSYDAGFTVDLLAKDVRLFLAEVEAAGTRQTVARMIGQTLEDMRQAMPGADFTNVYKFVRDAGRDRAKTGKDDHD